MEENQDKVKLTVRVQGLSPWRGVQRARSPLAALIRRDIYEFQLKGFAIGVIDFRQQSIDAG